MSNPVPTPAQIQQVQANLKNMADLNDYVYDTAAVEKVMNAYLLVTSRNDAPSDVGLQITLNILMGALRAAGSALGPGGTFAASFLCGMLTSWATNTPPNLNTSFSHLLERLEATKVQVDQTLTVYHEKTAENWNTKFTYDGHTATLSDFATVKLPAKDIDPSFYTAALAAIYAMDQQIWHNLMLANCNIKNITKGWGMALNVHGGDAERAQSASEISQSPSHYVVWAERDTGNGTITYYMIYDIGTGDFQSLSNGACQYLFIDSTDNVVINSKGLFHRSEVFRPDFGIRGAGGVGGVGLPFQYFHSV